MHPPGERERERARLQKGVWLQLRNSSRLKERTVWEERKRRERRRELRGFIGEEGKRGEVHGMENCGLILMRPLKSPWPIPG